MPSSNEQDMGGSKGAAKDCSSNYSAASFCFGSFSAASAQSPSELLRTGMQALEAKNFPRALEIFSTLAKNDPSPTNVGYLAVAESGAGNLSQAIADFKQAIKLGNDSVLTRYGLGSAYLRNHEPEAAARELRLAIVKDPNNIPARYALGVALLDLGRAHEAIPYLEQARKASPSNSQIWISLAQAQFEAGNPQTAVKLTDDATAAIPDNPQLSGRTRPAMSPVPAIGESSHLARKRR